LADSLKLFLYSSFLREQAPVPSQTVPRPVPEKFPLRPVIFSSVTMLIAIVSPAGILSFSHVPDLLLYATSTFHGLLPELAPSHGTTPLPRLARLQRKYDPLIPRFSLHGCAVDHAHIFSKPQPVFRLYYRDRHCRGAVAFP